MKTWVTSDHHFGHANILQYCSRPFECIEEHDDALINAWNNAVGVDDLVYHLGDVTLGSDVAKYTRKLNGDIRVLSYPWHHDSRWIKPTIQLISAEYSISASGFEVLLIAPMIVIENVAVNKEGRGIPITLCHYPLDVWDRSHYGAMHLHGHSHGTLPNKSGRMDVGVDVAYKLFGEYRPFLLDECIEFIQANMEITNEKTQ